MTDQKLNKWTLKRIAKLLGLDWSEQTEQRILALSKPSDTSLTKEEFESGTQSNIKEVVKNISNGLANDLENQELKNKVQYQMHRHFDMGEDVSLGQAKNIKTGFCIVDDDNGKTFKVVKIKFDLEENNVIIAGVYDTEPRAIFERGRAEAEHRANEFRQRKHKQENK